MPAPIVDLAALGADVEWTDREAGSRTVAAMPAGLGRLVELADWLSSVQKSAPPHEPARVRLLQLGRPGPAAVEALAADLDVVVQVADVLPADADGALAAGIALADRIADGGSELVVLACPGAGLASAIAVCALAGAEPVRVLARGAAATDPQAWMRRAEQVRDGRRRVVGLRERPELLLAELADPVLAAATGFVLQAALRRTAVLLDGAGAAAAALVAYQAQPRLVRWLAMAGTTPDPAHALAVTTLGMRCILDLGIDTGDGTAGLTALTALRSAARLAADHVAGEPGADGHVTDALGPVLPAAERTVVEPAGEQGAGEGEHGR